MKYGKNLPYHLQYLYFFIGNIEILSINSMTSFDLLAAPLLFPLYFQFMTIRHAVKRGKWQVNHFLRSSLLCMTMFAFQDVAWLALFYLKYFVLMSWLLGLLGAIKFLFILR